MTQSYDPKKTAPPAGKSNTLFLLYYFFIAPGMTIAILIANLLGQVKLHFGLNCIDLN